MAYFRDDRGGLSPVRDTMNTDNDGDWISLKFSEYDGPRIRLGVIKVINKAPEAEVREGDDRIAAPVAGIQEMLTAALYETKRFDVVEEKRIQEVESEQMRKDVQEPSPNSIMNVGRVLGAQYLVYGTVNEWNPNRASSSMKSGRGILALGSKILGNDRCAAGRRFDRQQQEGGRGGRHVLPDGRRQRPDPVHHLRAGAAGRAEPPLGTPAAARRWATPPARRSITWSAPAPTRRRSKSPRSCAPANGRARWCR